MRDRLVQDWTGVTKNQFLELCKNAPSRTSLGCLLVKYRKALSDQAIADLFDKKNSRTNVERWVNEARISLYNQFVPKYLGIHRFEADNRGRGSIGHGTIGHVASGHVENGHEILHTVQLDTVQLDTVHLDT
ncbi:vacuolar protein sorting-associated protein 13c [Lasius niger]|uniref:Vacuolar protein sorting-associated protein 13c n=1 Tax=Lasius niger TaxID=67767 RepID=A0A0J7MMZ7_LASNI|nr:vacuolar protein sorting-associated protein 13c [Lasius niger]